MNETTQPTTSPPPEPTTPVIPEQEGIPTPPTIPPSPSKVNWKKILLFGGIGLIFLIILSGGIFLFTRAREGKFPGIGIKPTPTISEEAPSVPSTPGIAPGGIPLIGGKQEIIGSAQSTRNLVGMLAQINQVDACLYPQLVIYVSVTDKDGKPMTNILQSDFKVFVDNREIKDFTLTYMGQQATPLTVSLVIDHSGSMKGEPMTKAKEAAVTFVQQLERNDKVVVVQFDTQVELLKEATTDKNAVISAINAIASRSDTALYDAAAFAAENLGPCGRKAIVLLTDGRDTASKANTLEQALNKVNKANIPVFVVGLKSPQFTPEILRQIAEGSGAQYLETPTPAELSALYQKINEQLQQQYQFLLTLNLPKDNLEHRVRLESNVAGSTTTSEKSYIIP